MAPFGSDLADGNPILKRLDYRCFGIPDVRIHLKAAVVRALGRGLRPRRILDAACGPGFYGLLFAGAELVGVDCSAQAIEGARAFARRLGATTARFEVMDIETEVPEGPFDLILVVDALQFLDDVGGALGRLAGRLAPQGHLLVVSPVTARRGLWTPRDLRRVFGPRILPFGEVRGSVGTDRVLEALAAHGLEPRRRIPYARAPGRFAKDLFYLAASIHPWVVAALHPLLALMVALDARVPGPAAGLGILASRAAAPVRPGAASGRTDG